MRWMVISDRVSVPVLSEAITEADPRVSTDERFLTMALRFAIRCTPIASTTERIDGQALGHGGDRERDPQQQDRHEVRRSPHVRHEHRRDDHHQGDDDHRDAERAPQAADLPLERGRVLPGGLQHLGDAPHLRAHADARDDGPPDALGDGGALVGHVRAVAEGDLVGDHRGGLLDGLALAGERAPPGPAARTPGRAARRPRCCRPPPGPAGRRGPGRGTGSAASGHRG